MKNKIFPFNLEVHLIDKEGKEYALFDVFAKAIVFPGDEPEIEFSSIFYKGVDFFPMLDGPLFRDVMQYIEEKCLEYIMSINRSAAMPIFNRDDND
jgi:hypothetical protein